MQKAIIRDFKPHLVRRGKFAIVEAEHGSILHMNHLAVTKNYVAHLGSIMIKTPKQALPFNTKGNATDLTGINPPRNGT